MSPFALFSYLILSTTSRYPIDPDSALGTTNGFADVQNGTVVSLENESDVGINFDTIVDSINETFGVMNNDPIGNAMNGTFLDSENNLFDDYGNELFDDYGNELFTDDVTENDMDEITEADENEDDNVGVLTHLDFLFILGMVFLPFCVVEYLNSRKPSSLPPLPVSVSATSKPLNGQPPSYEPPPPYECSIINMPVDDQKLPSPSTQGGKAHWQTLKHVIRWLYMVRTSTADKKKLMFVTS